MALLSAAHLDYSTIVLEPNRKLYVRQRPFEIVKAACIDGGATYEGRKDVVMALTNIKHKVPIPINRLQQIYAFPTHSPQLHQCSWLFYHHIKAITPHPSKQTLITFNDLQKIQIPISYYKIERQYLRTAACILHFAQPLYQLQQQRSPEKIF